MAKKITELTATTSVADGDLLPMVDVSDTDQSVNGSTRKITRENYVGTSTPTELNRLDGVTPGTVAASKAVVVDSDKDIGNFGTITIDDDEDLAFASGAKLERAAGHLVLTPESSKLVKIQVLRQDNISNAYKNNTIFLSGWGYIQGDGTIQVLESVSFGITFSALPILLTAQLHRKGSAPANIGEFDVPTPAVVQSRSLNITISGFDSYIRSEGGTTLAVGTYHGYSWLAVGELD